MKAITLIGAAAVLGLAAALAGVANENRNQRLAEEKWHSEWNVRGYVRCHDGQLEIGNIDFDHIKMKNNFAECDHSDADKP